MADSFLGDIAQSVGGTVNQVGPQVGQVVGALGPALDALAGQQQLTEVMGHLVEVMQTQHDAMTHVIDSLPDYATPVEPDAHVVHDEPVDVHVAPDAPTVDAYVAHADPVDAHVADASHADDGSA